MDEFLRWEEQQPERSEFVDGRPVMMIGGSQAHVLIATNLLSVLCPLRHGSLCRPGGLDLRRADPRDRLLPLS
jgi:Uma2 family endonuclease